MREPYPLTDATAIDHEAIKEMRWVMNVIAGIRNIRGEMDIAPSKLLPVLLAGCLGAGPGLPRTQPRTLATLARTDSITCLKHGDTAPESATTLVGNMQVLVPLGS